MPPGEAEAGMSDFRGGLAFGLVDFGWFQAPPGRVRPIFDPILHNSTLISFAAVRFETISTLFGLSVVNFRFQQPAVFKDAFRFFHCCPLPGEGPEGYLPSNIDGVGPVSVRIRGVI